MYLLFPNFFSIYVDPDDDENSGHDANDSVSIIKLDSKCNRTKVDIFVKAPFALIEIVGLNDVVLLTGVRCTEEKYTDETNAIRTSAFRLIIPDETTVDCKVFPPNHSCFKQVSLDLVSVLKEKS